MEQTSESASIMTLIILFGVAMLILSNTSYTRCIGHESDIPTGPYPMGGYETVCDGYWVSGNMPTTPSYYWRINMAMTVGGLVIGALCFFFLGWHVVAGYFILLGQVFNPLYHIPFTRSEWILMDEIATYSFVILFLCLLIINPGERHLKDEYITKGGRVGEENEDWS